MDVCSISNIEQSPFMRQRTSPEDEEEMEPLPPNHTGPGALEGVCAVTLNIGGRNSNPVEFVMQGDESELGVACTALGEQLLEAMGSDTFGPQSGTYHRWGGGW